MSSLQIKIIQCHGKCSPEEKPIAKRSTNASSSPLPQQHPVPSHKFSLILFAKENAANSARNVRKVTLYTRNRVRRKCENSPIHLKYRKRFARAKKKKKKTRDRHDVRGRGRGRRNQTKGDKRSVLKRYAFRHASVCTAYVRRP